MEIHTPEKLPSSSAFHSVSIKVHPIRPENLHPDLWSSPSVCGSCEIEVIIGDSRGFLHCGFALWPCMPKFLQAHDLDDVLLLPFFRAKKTDFLRIRKIV